MAGGFSEPSVARTTTRGGAANCLSSRTWTSCFSITHSKQGINPTQELREILTPDLEAVARQLNSRVQAAFASVKAAPPKPARAAAGSADYNEGRAGRDES